MESDEELMVRVAAGDELALGTLVDRYAPSIQRFLLRLTRNPEDAEDLTQDTWVRVARGARGFDERRKFKSWAYGIALNLARDLFRRRQVRARGVPEPTAKGPPPVSIDGIDVRTRVDALPDRLKEVLVLRYFEELGEAEMAETLGIPKGTVKSRLHAAVRQLKRAYEETN